MGLADALNEPLEIEIGETTLRLYQITPKDLAEFEQWVVSRRVAAARAAFEPVEDETETEAARREIAKDAAITQILFASPDQLHVPEELASSMGIIYRFYLSMRHGEPDLTFETTAQRLAAIPAGDLAAFSRHMMRGGKRPDESDDDPGNVEVTKSPTGAKSSRSSNATRGGSQSKKSAT